MPNHITNIVRISCSDQKRKEQVLLSMLNERGCFDFNRVISMPEILKGTSSPNTKNAGECVKATGYSDWYEWSRANWGSKWNAYENKLPYETVSHKPWHVARKGGMFFGGGRKLRCYPARINKKRFKRAVKEKGVQEFVNFQTAWATPEPVFLSLSRKFPDVIINIQYADEDTGSNCGTFSLKGGDVIEHDIAPSWSKQTLEERRKWSEFAFNMTHPDTDPRSYGYDEDWQYSEDVETAYYEEQEA